MNEYVAMWKNFSNFKDQTSRKGYWMAVLINFIIGLILGFIGVLLNTNLLGNIYSLLVLIPSIAISIRRLNDIGKKWPWVFIVFVPIAGPIIYLVFMCTATKVNGVQV